MRQRSTRTKVWSRILDSPRKTLSLEEFRLVDETLPWKLFIETESGWPFARTYKAKKTKSPERIRKVTRKDLGKQLKPPLAFSVPIFFQKWRQTHQATFNLDDAFDWHNSSVGTDNVKICRTGHLSWRSAGLGTYRENCNRRQINSIRDTVQVKDRNESVLPIDAMRHSSCCALPIDAMRIHVRNNLLTPNQSAMSNHKK